MKDIENNEAEDVPMDIEKFMRMSVDIMRKSVQERRVDSKPSPYVGAVIVMPDGKFDTAYRGELREGDHAEFTLLERKHRSDDVAGSILFATLEPCAPGARNFPKLGCAERIVNARIRKVYVGIEDPDPTVCRKGIAYLLENGVEVEMYPRDLQEEIVECNKSFLEAANERARIAAEETANPPVLTQKELGVEDAVLDDLDETLLQEFLIRAGVSKDDKDTQQRYLIQMGVLENRDGSIVPTGIGYMLFGNRPQLKYPQTRIRCVLRRNDMPESIRNVDGPLLGQPQKLIDWYKDVVGDHLDRSDAVRKTVYDYPTEVFNELAKNAILHRDYDIDGAPIYVEVNDDAIIIKSPGLPIPPIVLDQIRNFSAPSLSRNPKIIFAFDLMGMAEQRGLGFSTVKELRSKHGIPLPIVRFDDPYIVFTLPRCNDSRELGVFTPDEIKVIELLRLNGPMKRIDIERNLKVEKKKANRILDRLKEKGKIAVSGQTRATVYSLIDSI